MKLKFNQIVICSFLGAGFLLSSCKKEDQNIVEDIDQTAALKKVTVTYDSLTYVLEFPAEALTSGKSFEELKTQDSATYCNPENYSVTLAAHMLADNTKDDAGEAKFDGMSMNLVMDTLKSTPVKMTADPFTMQKHTTQTVIASGGFNLKTHRLFGLYMFRQMVDGTDLVTTAYPILNYKIGSTAGTIPLPEIHKNIPTRADQKTKDFLSGLLNSGVFDNP